MPATHAFALLVALTGCEALALGATSRLPAPASSARAVRAAIVMQTDSDEPSDVVPEHVPEPVPEPAPEPAPEPVAEEVVAEEAPEPDPFESMPPLEDTNVLDEGAIAKEALMAEVSGGLGASSKPDRAVVGEILLALEAQNPTRSPATSPLLNGKWKFVYASAASPGLKALQQLLRAAKAAPKSPSGADVVDVADVYLSISPDQPRAVSEIMVRLLSFENTLKLACRLEADSAVRLTETYDAAESGYMNLRLPFQSPVEYKRSLLISYLDDDLLVVRDALGRADILMRCDPNSWSPSSEMSGKEMDETAEA